MTAVTPRLWVASCHFDHQATADIDTAVELLRAGKTVVVPTLDDARDVLSRCGAPEEVVDYRISRAKSRIARNVSD